jgi:hypothetical protein
MRQKIWSADDVKGSDTMVVAEAGQLRPANDRVAELLAMLDGGEGNTPCSVGVPPWFLSAAHDRLAEMTDGTAHAEKVDAAFAAGGPSNGRVSPDKVALALAGFDEKFLSQIQTLSRSHAGRQPD